MAYGIKVDGPDGITYYPAFTNLLVESNYG